MFDVSVSKPICLLLLIFLVVLLFVGCYRKLSIYFSAESLVCIFLLRTFLKGFLGDGGSGVVHHHSKSSQTRAFS